MKIGAKAAADREAAAVAAYLATHPYASATELAEIRAAERAKDPRQVPYFDLTVSAAKSVSVLHASYRVSARQARQRGDHDRAAALDARADELEAALMNSAGSGRLARAARDLHAHRPPLSALGGVEWRDGAGLTASLFLHHLSRDGDPQLHVHVAIWNGSSAPTASTASGGRWTRAACTTSGWPSPRSPTGSWRPS